LNKNAIHSIINVLREAGLSLTAEDFVDAVHLAAYLPVKTEDPILSPEPPKLPSDGDNSRSDRTDQQSDTTPTKDSETKSKPSQETVNVRQSTIHGKSSKLTLPGVETRLSGAGGLENSLPLARGLRPFRKRFPNERVLQFDEQKTAEAIAASDIWMPVLRKGTERWLDLMLVIDVGGSYPIWRREIHDVRSVLQTVGAFRRVESICFDADDPKWANDKPPSIYSQEKGAISKRHPLTVVDSSERRLLLIISDCVGHAWWDGRAVRLIQQWTRSNHCAMLNLLPGSMWSRTGIGRAHQAFLKASRPACPNAQSEIYVQSFLGYETYPAKGTTTLPVLELEPDSISSWSKWASSETAEKFPARMFRHFPELRRSSDSAWTSDPGHSFQMFSSPQAQKLATVMSVVPPFTLPLLRVIADSIFPGNNRAIEAEFLLGGIVNAIQGEQNRFENPNQVVYDFVSDLRSRYRESVSTEKARRVLCMEPVSQFLTSRLGLNKSFAAILESPGNHVGELEVKQKSVSDPIAQFTSQTVAWLGREFQPLLQTTSVEQDSESTTQPGTYDWKPGNGDTSDKDESELEQVSRESLPILWSFESASPVTAFAWSPDGSTLCVPDLSGSIRQFQIDGNRDDPIPIPISSLGLNQVSYSKSHIAIACVSLTARLVDRSSSKVVHKFVGHNSDVVRVSLSPDGKSLATGTVGGSLRIWNVKTLDRWFHRNRSYGRVRDLLWLSDTEIVVGYERRLMVYRQSHVEEVDQSGCCFAAVPKTQVLAIGQSDGWVQFAYSDDFRQVMRPFQLFENQEVIAVSVSDDGELLAAKAKDGSIAICDLNTARRFHLGRSRVIHRRQSTGPETPHSWLAFRPQSHQLAVSVEGDRRIDLLDLEEFVESDFESPSNVNFWVTSAAELGLVALESTDSSLSDHHKMTHICIPYRQEQLVVPLLSLDGLERGFVDLQSGESLSLELHGSREEPISFTHFPSSRTDSLIEIQSEETFVNSSRSVCAVFAASRIGNFDRARSVIVVQANLTEEGNLSIPPWVSDQIDKAQNGWVFETFPLDRPEKLIGVVRASGKILPISSNFLKSLDFKSLKQGIATVSRDVWNNLIETFEQTSDWKRREALAHEIIDMAENVDDARRLADLLNKEDSPAVRLLLIDGVGQYASDSRVKEALLSSLDDDVEIRKRVVEIFSNHTQNREIRIALLERLISEPNEDVLITIIDAFHSESSNPAIKRTLELRLEQGASDKIRQMIERILDRNRSPHPQEPEYWICVTGVAGDELTEGTARACKKIGKTLAKLGFGLVTGGFSGVDQQVSVAFYEELSDRVSNPDAFVLAITARKSTVFPKGNLKRSKDPISAKLKICQAVIVIDGIEGPIELAENALKRRIPVLPIVGLGPQTDELFNRIVRDWSYHPTYPITRFQFTNICASMLTDPELPTYLNWLVHPPTTHHLTNTLRIEGDIKLDDPVRNYSEYVNTVPGRVLKPTQAFRLGIRPVTQGDYYEFVSAGGYDASRGYLESSLELVPPRNFLDGSPELSLLDHPVSGICFDEAQAYCRWLNDWNPQQGWRWQLPTEDMWEYAARISGRRVPSEYPWGDDTSDFNGRCNSLESNVGGTTPTTLDRSPGGTPDGCTDMAGNVWEFVQGASGTCFLRGGSYRNDRHQVKSCIRLWGVPTFHKAPDFGFRVALVEDAATRS